MDECDRVKWSSERSFRSSQQLKMRGETSETQCVQVRVLPLVNVWFLGNQTSNGFVRFKAVG